jgi:hypothetical protein
MNDDRQKSDDPAMATADHLSELERHRQASGQSYDEVLLFLKHEDDKINRVLTALAFLTAAGVTLYIFSRSDPNAYADFPRFANSGVRVDDYFFGSFIIGVGLSVALTLVALDPTSFLPGFLSEPPQRKDRSLLYYRHIAAFDRDEWDKVFAASDFFERYVESLHHDAHRLSKRAMHKVRRFGLASPVVQLTVAALALLGVARLIHVSTHGRWILLTAILVGYVVLPIVDFTYLWFLDFPDLRGDRKEWTDVGLALLFLLPFIAVEIAGLITRYRDWEPVTLALFGTVWLRWVERFEWRRLPSWVQPVVMMATALVASLWLWWN